jgi:hypothetical protein
MRCPSQHSRSAHMHTAARARLRAHTC